MAKRGNTTPWRTLQGDVTIYYHLLPFLEQDNLHGRKIFGTAGGVDVWTAKIKTFKAPHDPSPQDEHAIAYSWLRGNANTNWAATSYAYNYRVFARATSPPTETRYWWTSYKIATIPDGSSNTIFFAEKMMYCPNQNRGNLLFHGGWNRQRAPMFNGMAEGVKFQTGVTPNNCNMDVAHAFTAGGIGVAHGDGSVRLISNNVSTAVWARLVNASDGEVVGDY